MSEKKCENCKQLAEALEYMLQLEAHRMYECDTDPYSGKTGPEPCPCSGCKKMSVALAAWKEIENGM